MGFKLKSGNTSAFKMMGSSPVKQKANKPMMAAEKKYDSGKTTSKSDADLFIARSTDVKNPRTGENLATENMESGSEKKGYRIPVTKGKEKRNMGLYTVKDEETGKEVPVDPRDESIAPSNVVKGVKAGSDYQKAFKKYNKSRKKSPTKQKYDLSKATVDGKHPQTEKNKKHKDVDSKDLFMQGKTRDKDGNVKDIQWAPGPPKRPKFKNLKKIASPTKQRSTKGGEGQDQDKIFDAKGKHVGTYVNGKKVMKSTKSAHGQLNDAEREFQMDLKMANEKKPYNKPMEKISN